MAAFALCRLALAELLSLSAVHALASRSAVDVATIYGAYVHVRTHCRPLGRLFPSRVVADVAAVDTALAEGVVSFEIVTINLAVTFWKRRFLILFRKIRWIARRIAHRNGSCLT